MDIGTAYLKFVEKVNKNYTNDNISVDRGRFITIYNEESNKFVEWLLEKRNEDEIRDIQLLLVNDKSLVLKGKTLNHQDFTLPSDYFNFSNIQALASTNDCKDKKLLLTEIKSENREELLHDEFNKPSFKYRESFYMFSNNTVNIYTDDFDISKVYLTYYRYPKQVDIEGYTRDDNTTSTNIDPEFDDKVVNRILTACSKAFNINNDNLQRMLIDRDRLYSKI